MFLREESRLRVIENKILRGIYGPKRGIYGPKRGIYGPKRDENGEWRRLHYEELHSLYRSPNIVRVIKNIRLRWAFHVARMKQGKSFFFKILTVKPTERRSLGMRRGREY